MDSRGGFEADSPLFSTTTSPSLLPLSHLLRTPHTHHMEPILHAPDNSKRKASSGKSHPPGPSPVLLVGTVAVGEELAIE
jgi:hypothetical protein